MTLTDRSAARGRYRDRTLKAMRRQMAAMGCDRYEIGIHGAKGMIERTWTRPEAVNAVPWLRRQNARREDIYIRPAADERHGLVLLDDVDHATAEQIRADGLAVVAILETSPKNCQAWIDLGAHIEAPTRAAAARLLAQRYGGDPNSADARHYGRLAGFVNTKPEYITERGSPYILLRRAAKRPDGISPATAALLAEARRRATAAQTPAPRPSGARYGIAPPPPSPDAARAAYRAILGPMRRRYGVALDYSRVDWAFATDLLRSGYSQTTVAQAIEAESPEIQHRKAGHVRDYILRTVQCAATAVDALETRRHPPLTAPAQE